MSEWHEAVLVELRGLRADLAGARPPSAGEGGAPSVSDAELVAEWDTAVLVAELRRRGVAPTLTQVRRADVLSDDELVAACRERGIMQATVEGAELARLRAAIGRFEGALRRRRVPREVIVRLREGMPAGEDLDGEVAVDRASTEALAAEMRARATRPILTGAPPVPWETVVAWCRSEARITAAEDGPAQDHPAAMERVAAQVVELVAAADDVVAVLRGRVSDKHVPIERLEAALAGGPDVGGVLFVEDLASILADPAVKSEYLLDELRRRGEVEDV